jgi:hypothetical protein
MWVIEWIWGIILQTAEHRAPGRGAVGETGAYVWNKRNWGKCPCQNALKPGNICANHKIKRGKVGNRAKELEKFLTYGSIRKRM